MDLPTATSVPCEGSGQRPTNDHRCPVCGITPWIIHNNTFPDHHRRHFPDIGLESIVRDLAISDPVVNEAIEGDSVYRCALCTDLPHELSCPWRRAREWVDAHPEPKPVTFRDMAPGWRL